MSNSRQPAGLVQSPAYDIPARDMVGEVKRIVSSPPISLPVEDQQDGMILTGWQPFRGEFHIARYWYERTRYHLTIVPDFNDPAKRSRIQVTDETEQRPDESGPNESAKRWTPAPDLHRPERSAALLQQIETQLGNLRR
ncbi:MAG TPA: hypothetical protein VLJ39_01965 [Tepidisphaeraceae bacterium]|nr:hypothetical protein [Tepidisphaeraceae bacterium]